LERWGRVEGEGWMGMEKGQCAVLSHFDPLRRRGKGKRGERKGDYKNQRGRGRGSDEGEGGRGVGAKGNWLKIAMVINLMSMKIIIF